MIPALTPVGPILSAALGARIDPHGLREGEGEDAGPAFILDLDPMIEVQPAELELVAHQRPGAGQRRRVGGLAVRQFDPVLVEEDAIVVNVKEESRHALAIEGAGRRRLYLNRARSD